MQKQLTESLSVPCHNRNDDLDRRSTEPSKSKSITSRTESVCSNPDATTKISSSGYDGSPNRSKTTGSLHNGLSQLDKTSATFAGVPVFQLLQNQDVDYDEDTDLEQITTWVDEMRLYPDGDRAKNFEKVFLDVDGIIAAGDASGQRQRPAEKDAAGNSSSRPMATILSRFPQKRRRKEASGEGSSQVSRQESETNNNPTGHRVHSRTPFDNLLSCPFVKRDPIRYEFVANPCTERFGFPNPGRVVEHVKRYHSLRVPCCITCKERFNGNKTDAEQAQQYHIHRNRCRPRHLKLDEPEWMDADQDSRFANINILGVKSSAEDKWRHIYRQIFGLPDDSTVPDPYYDYLRPTHHFHVPSTQENRERDPLNNSGNDGRSHQGNDIFTAGASSSANTTDNVHLEMLEHRPALQQPILFSDNFGASALSMSNSPAFLTAELLDMNEKSQPERSPFTIYQGFDSGYQSLGQMSGMETIVPIDPVLEYVDLSALASETQLDTGPSGTDGLRQQNTSLDLMGLEMSSSQFPDSVVAERKEGKSLENEVQSNASDE